jgi:hypothetical protein
MDKKKKNLLEMRKLGFTNKTLSLMTESQIAMILEKIKKKESKEATMTYRPDEEIPAKNIDPTKMKKNADGSVSMETTEATITYRPDEEIPAKNIDPTKMKKNADGSVSTEVAEGKKKKKYNPWAVCTSSVGRKNKKKYEDCVMGVKKKIKEGRNPYEYLIESKMEEIVENNLSPKMTKGELLRIIAEKKMMMKKPIGNINGETMEGDTKTAPAPTRTTPKTDPGTKPSHPGRRSKEQPNPKPKAKSDSEMESKKSEIITAISNLIDKALK